MVVIRWPAFVVAMSGRPSPSPVSSTPLVPARLDDGLGFEACRENVRDKLFGFRRPLRLGDRYDLGEQIGRGGMGAVYVAHDTRLDRKVAVKVLSKDVAGGRRGQARLYREALLMARVGSSYVVPVYDVGVEADRVYVVMEFVEGPTLRDWCAHELRSWSDVLAVMLEAGQGLVDAHAAGVIHRDFKPDNVMVDLGGFGRKETLGRARVLDFGLASSGEARGEAERHPYLDPELSPPLTRTGALLGTPSYMAPELFHGAAADERSDQFAFCVTLYEALYGVPPFAGDSVLPLLDNVRAHAIRTPPSDRDAPGWLHQLVCRGMQPDPQRRFESMQALLDVCHARIVGRRARPRVVMLSSMAVAAAAVGWLGWDQLQRRTCASVEGKLAGIWDEGQKVAVRSAMEGTNVAYAQAAYTDVERTIDAYTSQWIESHADACTQTNVLGQQSEAMMDLRIACLDAKLVHMDALVDVLKAADAKTVETAATAVRELPLLRTCSDAQWLANRTKPPDDPTTLASVEKMRAELANVEALVHTGRFADALVEATEQVALARELGYRPALAEALVHYGRALSRLAHYVAADEALREAFFVARRARVEPTAAEAARALVDVSRTLGNYEGSLTWARHADAELGDDPDAAANRAALQAARGETLRALVRYGEAEQQLLAARDWFERERNTESPQYASTLGILSKLYAEQSNFDQAVEVAHEAADIGEAIFGSSHPQTANLRSVVGYTLWRAGKYAEARAELLHAVELAEAALGPSHPEVAKLLLNVGTTHHSQRHAEKALPYYRRALAIREETFGPEHPKVAETLNNIGLALDETARDDEALVAHRRALAIRRKLLSPDDPQIANSMADIAVILRDKGEHQTALAMEREVLAMRQAALGPDAVHVGYTHANIGLTLRAMGRYPESLDNVQRGMDILLARFGPEHPIYAQGLLELAEAQALVGRYADALQSARASLAVEEKTNGPDDPVIAKALLAVADAHRVLGHAQQAAAHYRRVLEIAETAEVKAKRLERARAGLEALGIGGD